ncbi:MAG TPA: DNA integrity scanning protein DisA nucleotide-binding domain protein [Thermoguttaceae bacterium]|nr:DNA integrity scanning protein DisA nucleotide-binding domain protein [Thermoguttaceae bacterium]
MQPLRLTDQFKTLLGSAAHVGAAVEADALLLLVDGPADWPKFQKLWADQKLLDSPPFLVAAVRAEHLEGAGETGMKTILLDMPDSPVSEQLTQALLEAVADDLLSPGSRVVALYSGFEADVIDSISLINLGDHLDRLTGQDLRKLETCVPLDTLKIVVDLAVEIGRDGREGHSIGTMFVVGDSRSVLTKCRAAGFDPVRGYKRQERNLDDPRVREGIKEIAQLDGAIIVAADNTVEATCRLIDAPATNLTLSKGLGARHWAAAAITRATKAVAVTVSQSSGTVRVFQNGEVMLRIEPTRRRPMVWREFEYEPPAASSDG